MVTLSYKGTEPYRVLNILCEPGKDVKVTEEAAWIILNESARAKDFVVQSGQPVRPSQTPARWIGKTAMDEAVRLPDEPAVSLLPATIPSDIRESLKGRSWKARLPGLIERHHASALAVWCALEGLPEQAEAICKLVTVKA